MCPILDHQDFKKCLQSTKNVKHRIYELFVVGKITQIAKVTENRQKFHEI